MVKFSIVIPVAPDREAPVVESLKRLDYKDYEVIVEKGTNPSANRNNGVKKAKGEIILFLDDDAYVDKDLLKNGEEFFKKYPNVSIVGGPQLTPKSDKWFARTSGYAIASYFGTQNMSKRYKKGKLDLDGWNVITSAVCFVKKEVFEKIEGFDERLFPGEDPEFFYRAKKNGFRVAYSPELIIYHKRRDSLGGFLKQFYLYGRVRKETGKINLIFLIPSLFLIYLVLSPFLFFINRWSLIPLGLYVIVDFSFSFYETIKNRDLRTMILLVIYPLIHISYGVGVLSGVLSRKR